MVEVLAGERTIKVRHVGRPALASFIPGHTSAPEHYHKHLTTMPMIQIHTPNRASAQSYFRPGRSGPGWTVPLVVRPLLLDRSGFDAGAGDVESGDRGEVAAGSDGDFLVAVEDAQVGVTGTITPPQPIPLPISRP